MLIKPDNYATCGLFSSVSSYILLEMTLVSEHLQTDGFESFWYSNIVFSMTAFTIGLSNNKGSNTLCPTWIKLS